MKFTHRYRELPTWLEIRLLVENSRSLYNSRPSFYLKKKTKVYESKIFHVFPPTHPLIFLIIRASSNIDKLFLSYGKGKNKINRSLKCSFDTYSTFSRLFDLESILGDGTILLFSSRSILNYFIKVTQG